MCPSDVGLVRNGEEPMRCKIFAGLFPIADYFSYFCLRYPKTNDLSV